MGIFKLNGVDYMGGSGGGGNPQPGLGYKETVLWENTSGTTSSSTITLSSALDNYDAIYIITASNAEPNYKSTQIIPVSAIDTTGTTNFGIFDTGGDNYYYVVLNYVDSTHITLSSWGSSYLIKYYKVVGINYGAGGTPIQPIIYSEEEREVGVWTDGKPLYEKTFYYSTLNVSRTDWTILEAFTLDKFIDVSVSFTNSNRYLDETYMKISYYNGNLYYHTPEINGTCDDAYITIQYTKTTDTPGSGIWTPSGVPAVHYSTDEHVVGTWIDGSTLYEKSYHVPTVTSTYITIDSTISASTIKLRDVSMGSIVIGGAYNNAQYVDGRLSYNSFIRVVLHVGLSVGMEAPPSEPITDFDFTIRYTKTTS